MSSLIIQDNKLENLPSNERFDMLVEMAVANKSKTSKRVYEDTYKRWKEYCGVCKIARTELYSSKIIAFIESRNTTVATRHRELAAMRKLLDRLLLIYPDEQAIKLENTLLKEYKISDGLGTERKHQALNPEVVTKVLSVWNGDDNRSKRNYAILALTFATGVRADELINLKWEDINFEDGTMIVWHGKGNKKRTVAIYGDMAIDALLVWREMNTGIFVFPPLTRWGDNIRQDKALCYRALRDIFHNSGLELDMTKLSPHDARHTLINEIVRVTGSVTDAQAQAGHSDASTTLRYTHENDAVERRKTKLRYG